MPRFSLTALGADRPGIVAAVTGGLVAAGCNLEDSTMAILQGQFAILLAVAAPEGADADGLREAVEEAAAGLDLQVVVRPLPGSDDTAGAPGPPGRPWVIAIHGADRPGIVHAVAAALAEGEGNIVDLVTHVVGTPEAPLYTLTVRALLPGDGAATAAQVQAAAEAVGVHCTAHPDDADIL